MRNMNEAILVNLNTFKTNEVERKITIKKILKMICEGKLILPGFQRNLVYTAEEMTNIILTALIDKGPLTSCSSKFLIVTDGGVYYLADGQQRLTTILIFLKDHPIIMKEMEKWLDENPEKNKVLNMNLSTPTLKFKINEKKYPHLKDLKKEMTGKTCHDFSNEVIEAFMDLTLNFVFVEETSENLIQTCRSSYNIFNTSKPLSPEEMQLEKYCENDLFTENLKFMHSEELIESVFHKEDKRFKLINFGIDTFNYLNGLYQSGSVSERENGYLSLSDPLSLKYYKGVFSNALLVAKKIFPEGYVFSEMNRYGKLKKMTLVSFMPWVAAITQTLKTDRNPEGLYTVKDFEKFSKSIITEWSKVSIPTGKNVQPFIKNGVDPLPSWCELATNNSNNKANVDMRVKTIKNIFEYCIKNSKNKAA